MEKEEVVVKQCPMSYNNSHTASVNTSCKKERCQWWMDNNCAVVRLAMNKTVTVNPVYKEFKPNKIVNTITDDKRKKD